MSLSKNEIKFVKSLHQKKFREQEGLFIVEGIKLVQELLNSQNFSIQKIYTSDLSTLDFPSSIETIEIGEAVLGRISALKTPNKVLALVQTKASQHIQFNQEGLYLLLDEIKDPGNFGTIIRTADWFGVKGIICSKNSVERYNPKVVQASMGAIFRCSIEYADLNEVVDSALEENLPIFGADMQGENAFTYEYPSKMLLVMGSESHGISPTLKSKLTALTIPKFGQSESLNVAMAAGILMAQFNQ